MSKINIKRIKCRSCGKSFKTKTTDFDKVIQECLNTTCDLKTKDSERLINQALSQFRPVVSMPKEPCTEVVIEDCVVIKVDTRGKETRTLS